MMHLESFLKALILNGLCLKHRDNNVVTKIETKLNTLLINKHVTK